MNFLKKAIFGMGVAVATTALFAPAAFGVSCVTVVQAADEMDFGHPKIGSDYSSEAALGAVIDTCPESKAAGYGYADCFFIDAIGIQYTVFEGRINRKDLLVEKTTESAQYPFGIYPEDSFQSVVNKLASYPQTSGLWAVYYDQDEIGLFMHNCFENVQGSRYGIDMIFSPDGSQIVKVVAGEIW